MGTLGLGILSWRAHETLRQTLESFSAGFLARFQDKVIYFSDIDDADRQIAAEFGFRAEGGPNEGIGFGMMRVVEAVNADYVVLLQNDCPVIVPTESAVEELDGAISLLEKGQASLVRLRHRWQGGELFGYARKYLKIYGVKSLGEGFQPELHGVNEDDYKDSFRKKLQRAVGFVKAMRMKGSSVFVEENPHLVHGDVIGKLGNFFIIDSSVLYFSDQPFMVGKSFFMDVLWKHAIESSAGINHRNGKMVLEDALHSRWWRARHFKIAQGTGIFTHKRYDRPYEQDFEKLLAR